MEANSLSKPVYPFLSGGEMGKLMRSTAWSKSSLGDPDTWPQSLQTLLTVVLNSRLPMCLFWGPELICFYNDAYQPCFKDTRVLGQRAENAWAEKWADVKPIIDQLLAGGPVIQKEAQLTPVYHNGKAETAYWTVCYSPVSNEAGQPYGVLITCTETTKPEEVLHHPDESRDQFFFAIDAAELGTWDLNLITHRFTANDRLKDWFGLPSNSEFELSLALEAIVGADQQEVSQAIWNALKPASGGQYDVTYTIANLITGQKRTVRAKGKAYFNELGVAYRFAGTAQDTTEQLLARQQMERAEQLAKLALEGAGAGSFYIDLADNNLTYSPTLSRIFTGVESTGLTRDLLLTYIVPEDRLIREKAYQQAAQTGKLRYEARTVWNDGSVHWLRVLGTYLSDSTGAYAHFAGIAQDITAEVEARAEQKKLLSLVENSHDYMAVSDVEGRQIYLNRAGRELTGLDPDQSITHLYRHEFYVPEHARRVRAYRLSSLLNSDEQANVVYLKHFKTGEVIPCNASYVKINDPTTGQQIGRGATLRDLRPELAFRKELVNSEAILQQVNQRLEMALEAGRLGSYELELATGRITCTAQCKANYGLPADITFDIPDLIRVMVPEDQQRVQGLVNDAVINRSVYNAEYRVIWPDGSLHWIRAWGRGVYDDNGKPLQMVGITLDVTPERMAQQRLERQVQERTQELTAANQALVRTNHELEQFAYIASHDLQEPLRKIQSFASLLQENQDDDQLGNLYLSKIIKSAQRMSALIKAVLNYSRLAKIDDQLEPTDLNQILQNVLSDFDLLIEQKEAVIEYSPLPMVVGIPLQLNQLFTNLIGNALKFTNSNPLIQISSGILSAEQTAQQMGLNPALSYIWLAVRDNGIGFEQQYANQIFALFQRLSNGKSYSGTGIGLAICKKIVDNHNGVIIAQSQPNQGATFTIYLPVHGPTGNS
ncbi:PAS domain-containing protein [Spirosoma soli]|uniref:histidine kinase n=1 Tax=Spirosoma soli TaxID=1770529 RepID=A0ABW5M339_9BACT